MKLVEMPLDEIEEAAYNPRVKLEPGMPQFERLKKSIQSFGQVDPLVWNERSKRLVGGRQRLTVMRHMGEKTGWFTVVDLDEDREKALNLALNNPNLQSEFDADKLIAMAATMPLEMLQLGGFDDSMELQEMVRRAELSQATSFLTEFMTGTDEGIDAVERPREIDLKEEHPHRTGPQMFEVPLIFTAEQRAIYYQALDRAKRYYRTDNSYEALVHVLGEFNTRWEQEHVQEGVDP